jgi:hypothetical protein
VQTDLLGSNNEPRAMPLADFIEETMRVLGTDADEVLVDVGAGEKRLHFSRYRPEPRGQ